jgi:RNA polymerase sigma-70 factor (ECF subfamily)
MLLHDARREGRTAGDGTIVLLTEQDRGSWDRRRIVDAMRLLHRALAMERPGPYQIQAAIAATHAEARTPEQTDWARIVALYDDLTTWTSSPVVALNRAVAIGVLRGPEEGLTSMGSLEAGLERYHLFHAARAHFLSLVGRKQEARTAYARALGLATNTAERSFLTTRIEALDGL